MIRPMVIVSPPGAGYAQWKRRPLDDNGQVTDALADMTAADIESVKLIWSDTIGLIYSRGPHPQLGGQSPEQFTGLTAEQCVQKVIDDGLQIVCAIGDGGVLDSLSFEEYELAKMWEPLGPFKTRCEQKTGSPKVCKVLRLTVLGVGNGAG